VLQSLPRQFQRQVLAGPRHQRAGPFVLTIAVGVAYFLAARLSLHLLTMSGVAILWPAAGVASGTLIALGRAARWPVAIGVIAANIAANLMVGRNVVSASIFALSAAGEVLVVAWIIERAIGSDFSLGRLRHMLALMAAAIVGTAVSGVAGTLGNKLAYNPDGPAWVVWWQWVTSGAIGIVAVAPLIIGFVTALRTPPPRRELIKGVVAVIAVAATVGTIILMLPADWWVMCVAVVLLFPVLLWVSASCQPAFVSAAVFAVSLIVMATVTFKLGNYGIAAQPMDESITSAQITVAGTALCAFVLSALFAEQRRHEAGALERQEKLVAELDHRVRNILAQVAAVATSTRQGSRSIDEFLRSLDGRIQSMASAHTC
jgi:integral membrane sensor domain MASE1